MEKLKGLKPEKVFEYFEMLCSVPRGSGNTKAVSDLCVEFAKKRGLRYYRDDVNNVVIYKPASPGCEDKPPVILQGHLDMVAVKTADCDLDMKTEGVRVTTDGEWVWADRTSLGGDDGIAVAMALAVLDDDSLVHPPIEALFTVDEETSMAGASYIDPAVLSGRTLLNLDSEEEGVFTVSCAGGLRCDVRFRGKPASCPGMILLKVSVDGLTGGHSGAEIHRGRSNAAKLLGRILYHVREAVPFRLESIEGGQFENVIMRSASAVVAVSSRLVTKFRKRFNSISSVILKELPPVEPNARFTCEKTGGTHCCLSQTVTDNVLRFLEAAPFGVQKMSPTIEGFVQTSLNLGVIRMEQNCVRLSFSIRSSVESEKNMVFRQLEALARLAKGTAAPRSSYPAWQFAEKSPVREIALQAYRNVYGGEAKVLGIHAGLECGLLSEKLPGLDAISFGPNLQDIHSVNERLNVASTERMYRMTVEMLRLMTL